MTNSNPNVTINLNSIKYNGKQIVKLCNKNNIFVTAVTKMHCCNENIVKALLECGVDKFADSRVENLKNINHINCEKWLLRLPTLSEVSEVVKYSDATLNSEYSIITELNKEAKIQDKLHKVILMWDLGDLREGYFKEEDLFDCITKILNLSNISLYGIATNLSCYGGVKPTVQNMKTLSSLAKKIQDKFNITLDVISGGNSTTYSLLLDNVNINGINNLRIGDTFYFGRDMQKRTYLEEMKHDAFVLTCEIIEIKDKSSIPIGEIGYGALNSKPVFEDRGIRKRAILNAGKQDIDLDIIPKDSGIIVLGASSDHLIVDITDANKNYNIGDSISFDMLYTSTMRAFTSKFVSKTFI